MRAPFRIPICLLLGLLLVGCLQRPEAPLPEPPSLVTVGMTEYRFDIKPLPARGAISFRVVNSGATDHDLTLIRVPPGVKSLDAQLRGGSRLYVVPIAEVKPRKPGEEGLFAVDLPAGRYGLICFVRDPDGIQHANKGMSAEFRVP